MAAERSYLPGLTLQDYREHVADRFPRLAAMSWFERPGSVDAVRALLGRTNEFEDDQDSGRGVSYRRAQRSRWVRAHGIRTLACLAADVDDPARIPRDWTMLDVLGGDGLLAELLAELAPQVDQPVITGDMAGQMVGAALDKDLPAIRQAADHLFLRDAVVPAVFIGYGTHHLCAEERRRACAEAGRVLRPGGRLVLHDFEEGSPMSLWFGEVVHRWSRGGHPYEHFTVDSMADCLGAAAWRSCRIRRVYDPLVVSADDPDTARTELAAYLLDMYGLVGLHDQDGPDVHETVWKLAQSYFVYSGSELPDDGGGARVQREPVVERRAGRWVAEIPRVALVAVAER